MKKLYLLSLFYLCFTLLSAQKNIISKGAESITIAELRDHMFYLASDELEGRKTGLAGYDKAAEYVVTQLRQAGLSPVSRMRTQLYLIIRNSLSINILQDQTTQ